MIQDIAPYQYKNEYKPAPPEKDSILLFYDGRKVLLKKDGQDIFFPTFRECGDGQDEEQLYHEYTYLFSIDSMRFYLGGDRGTELHGRVPEGYGWEDVRILRGAAPKYLSFAAVTGWQLYRWYDAHRMCGRCGKELVKDKKERMLSCPGCGLMEYPKICPAVIVAVTHGNRLLMSKYAGREYTKYALLAGFSEIGETLEETVRREVMEETGLKVKNITYYKSQPWSFSDTLLTGFFCELDGTEAVTLDEEELSFAGWFEREEIPAEYEDVSLTNEMMMAFKEGKRFSEERISYDETVSYGKTATFEMIRETPAAYQAGRQSQKKEQGSYTVEDYDNLPDEKRMELIDGVLYDMASPTSIHQALLWQIFKQISEHIEKKKGKCIPLFAPLDVQLDCDEKTMVQPDIIVVCDREKVKSKKIYGAPDFIVEILSLSTRRKDMVIKLSKYAAAGVREYWMVDPDRKKVVVHDFANENISVYGFDYEVPVGIFSRECMVDFKKIAENIGFLYDNR